MLEAVGQLWLLQRLMPERSWPEDGVLGTLYL